MDKVIVLAFVIGLPVCLFASIEARRWWIGPVVFAALAIVVGALGMQAR